MVRLGSKNYIHETHLSISSLNYNWTSLGVMIKVFIKKYGECQNSAFKCRVEHIYYKLI
jgi:hypothetical protein